VSLYDPPDDAVSVHLAKVVAIPGNSRARVTFTPRQTGTTFELPIVAASKSGESTYEVQADGSERYPQAGIPPTDIDDLSPCFMPPLSFNRELTMTIRNTRDAERLYGIQLVGWETAERRGA
jgi:hypothetical protein